MQQDWSGVFWAVKLPLLIVTSKSPRALLSVLPEIFLLLVLCSLSRMWEWKRTLDFPGYLCLPSPFQQGSFTFFVFVVRISKEKERKE